MGAFVTKNRPKIRSIFDGLETQSFLDGSSDFNQKGQKLTLKSPLFAKIAQVRRSLAAANESF